MDPISNADRLVLLLRQRLLERTRAVSGGRREAAAKSASVRVDALAGIEGVDDRQFRRALIQNLLAEQFGAAVMNEAEFQQVVDRVVETIGEDEVAAGLLDRVAADLRGQQR